MYKQIWRSPVWKLIVLAVVLNLYIELLNQKGVSGCIGFIRRDLAVFGINTLIILASLIPGMLFRRRLFYCTLLSLLWAVGGTINGAVLAYRITPFTTYDLDLLKTGLGVLPNYFTTWQIYAMGFGILAIFAILIIGTFPKSSNRGGYCSNLLDIPGLWSADRVENGQAFCGFQQSGPRIRTLRFCILLLQYLAEPGRYDAA